MSESLARPEVTEAAILLPNLSIHGLTLEHLEAPTFGGGAAIKFFRVGGPGVEGAEDALTDLGFRFNPITGFWMHSGELNLARMKDMFPNGAYPKKIKKIDAKTFISAPEEKPIADLQDTAADADLKPPVRMAVPTAPRIAVPPAANKIVPSAVSARALPGETIAGTDDALPPSGLESDIFRPRNRGLFGGLEERVTPPTPPPPTPPEIKATKTEQVVDNRATTPAQARAGRLRKQQIDIGPTLFDIAPIGPLDLPPPIRQVAPPPPQPAVATIANLPAVTLGFNGQDFKVLQLADGRRAIETKTGIRTLEDPGRPAGLYLRANTEADLEMVAAGLVVSLEKGQARTSADVKRLAAIMRGGDGTGPADPNDVEILVKAAETQMYAKILEASPASRQRAMAARFHRFTGQGWPDLGIDRDTLPVRRLVAEVENAEILTIDAITEDWAATTLAAKLASLPENGRLMVRARGADLLSPDTLQNGFLAGAVSTNIIEGAAIILPPLGGHKEGVLVFGAPRPEVVNPKDIPAAAFEVVHLTTPDQTWVWLDNVAAANERARLWMEAYKAGRTDIDLEETRAPNMFQAPYVGLSRGQVRNLMVPAALSAATAEALTNLSERLGDVDAYVAAAVGLPVEELITNYTGPQIDAAALNMDAHNRNRGFLLGDDTGAGKTRAFALVAKKAVREGKKVLIITEKSASFGDIIAEFQRGGLAEGINWFIMNNRVEIQVDDAGLAFTIGEAAKNKAKEKNYRVGETLIPSRKAAEIKAALYDADGNPVWPEGVNILMTTYSQAALSAKSKIRGKLTRQEQIAHEERVARTEWKANWFRKFDASNTVGIFDEVHNLTSPTSVTNSNLNNLIDRVERITYSTATSGNDPKQMGAYYRLLPGNDQEAKTHLPHILSRGGLEASEALTVAFVADGVARRCGLDFSDVAVKVLVSPNAERHRETLYALAPTLQGMMALGKVMQSVVRQQNMMQASRERDRIMKMAGLSDEARALEWKKGAKRGQLRAMGFSSPIYTIERTFAAVILGKEAGEYAVDLMLAGYKPTFQIDNTMQSTLAELYEEHLSQGDGDKALVVPTFRHFLRRVLEQITRVKKDDRVIDVGMIDAAQRRTMAIRAQSVVMLNALADLIEQTDSATPFKDLEAVREWMDITIPETIAAYQANAGRPPAAAGGDEVVAIAGDAADPMDEFVGDMNADEAEPVAGAAENAGIVGEEGVGEVLEPPAAIVPQTELSTADWRDVKALTDLLVEQVFDSLVVTPKNVADGLRAEGETLGRNQEIDFHKRMTIDLIEALPPEADLPLSYIDTIKETVEAAGFQMLEMTNRTLEARDGFIRPREPEEVAVVKHEFQNTVGAGLIIGSSGAASIGLHAAPEAKDQSPRVFVPFQWFADANRQKQVLGRFKRAGEVTPPEVHYYFSGIPTEARHISMMNRRFARLGANTDAARLSPVMVASVPDFHSPEGDRATARFLVENPEMREKLGIEIDDQRLYAIAGRQILRPVEVDVDEENPNPRETPAKDDIQSAISKEHQRLGNEVLMAATVMGRDQAAVLDGVSEQYWALMEEYEALGIETGRGRQIDGKVTIRGQMVFDPEVPPPEGQPKSVFDKAIILNVITIEKDIQSLRGQDILGLVDQAVMQGASRTFYEAALTHSRIADSREIRGAGWTVNDAMHEMNLFRLRREAERLHEMQPGMGIKCVSQEMMGHGIILEIEGRGEFNRRLIVLFPGDAKARSISLPAALNETVYQITPGLHGPDRESILHGFDTAQNERSAEVRYLLTGSEPRMLASDLGRFTIYQEGDGELKRGLLVSKKYQTLQNVRNRIPGMAAIYEDILQMHNDVENDDSSNFAAKYERLCEFNLLRGPGAGTATAGYGSIDLSITVFKSKRNFGFDLKLSNGSNAASDAFKITRENYNALAALANGEIVSLFAEVGRQGSGIHGLQKRYAEIDLKITNLYDEKAALEEAGEAVPDKIPQEILKLERETKHNIVCPQIFLQFTNEDHLLKMVSIIRRLYDEGFIATKNFPAKFSLSNDMFRRVIIEGGPLNFYGLTEVNPPCMPGRENRPGDPDARRVLEAALRERAEMPAGPDLFGGMQ